jgi:hypothetical protein
MATEETTTSHSQNVAHSVDETEPRRSASGEQREQHTHYIADWMLSTRSL